MKLVNTQPELISGRYQTDSVRGDIEFENVKFCYPARPGEYVLKDLSFKIQSKKTTAIVGDSGSGKSTITNMLLRL